LNCGPLGPRYSRLMSARLLFDLDDDVGGDFKHARAAVPRLGLKGRSVSLRIKARSAAALSLVSKHKTTIERAAVALLQPRPAEASPIR
jgi:hypothetical protein